MASSTYGTLPSSNQGNGLVDPTDQERAALLSKPDRRDHILTRVHDHFTRNVSRSWADLVLLAGYVITGLLDSSSVFIWGSFVSMQTGNTIYLGLGIVAPTDSDRWIRAAISIASFCVGSTFFAAYHRAFGQRTRWVLVSSYVFQLLLVIGAALMVTFGPSTGSQAPIDVWVGVPMALVAFQSAGQAVSSRSLQYSALTSVVLTSIYCDLFSDPHMLGNLRQNVDRNRRAAAPMLLLIGAMIGGIWAHTSFSLPGALWTAVFLKLLLVTAWTFWPADKSA